MTFSDILAAMGENERAIRSARERRDDERRRAERVVWLLGAGFSKGLGGPLFSELFDRPVANWVSAWLRRNKFTGGKEPDVALQTFRVGRDSGLWTNPEECLARLDEARTDGLARLALSDTLGLKKRDEVEKRWRLLSRFVAVATSAFVDRATSARTLPESWTPFEKWANSLNDNDTVVSFNYDRVVEELALRSGRGLIPIKLHGSVPEVRTLKRLIARGFGVSSISTPGPTKLSRASKGLESEWKKAMTALRGATRLVVIGYSFPVSDSFARSFILTHSEATKISIVVGPADGEAIRTMFHRVKRPGSLIDTGLLAEQFLAEGTARLSSDRFNHELWESK